MAIRTDVARERNELPLNASMLCMQRINVWLESQKIILDAQLRAHRHALETAASEIGAMQGLDPDPVLRALWRREQVGSNAIGCGVAIPHARIGGIKRPITLFIRSKWAIDFVAPDGKPVRNILVIMVPTDGDIDEHLQLLATIAQMFSDSAFREHIAAATNPDEARDVFADWSRANCTGASPV
jgi:nitrogen PTS system EIIA component